jgi:hypothetical protein
MVDLAKRPVPKAPDLPWWQASFQAYPSSHPSHVDVAPTCCPPHCAPNTRLCEPSILSLPPNWECDRSHNSGHQLPNLWQWQHKPWSSCPAQSAGSPIRMQPSHTPRPSLHLSDAEEEGVSNDIQCQPYHWAPVTHPDHPTDSKPRWGSQENQGRIQNGATPRAELLIHVQNSLILLPRPPFV